MSIILPYNRLARQLPQPSIVITTSRDKVRGIRRERTVPNPALVSIEFVLQRERPGVIGRALSYEFSALSIFLLRRRHALQIHGPDPRGVVRGTGREFSHVRGEQDAGDICAVGFEARDRHEAGDVADGDEAPDEDGAVDTGADGRAEQGAVGRDGDGGHALVLFGDELVAAFVFAEIPDADVAASVAGDEFALVGVDDDVVDGDAVGVVSLDVAAASVPDFDGAWWVGLEVMCCSMDAVYCLPSSELVTIHLPSQWNATPVMFPV